MRGLCRFVVKSCGAGDMFGFLISSFVIALFGHGRNFNVMMQLQRSILLLGFD